jgi:hypothetical protein
MTLSILVPQEALAKVQTRLDKLARTAGVAITEIPGTTTLIKDKRVLTCSRLTIGALPSVFGYEFAARIEHTKEGNVIARGPDETQDLDAAWRTAAPLCAHCGKQRHRKETFLLRQYGVALIQIGRNCLADFLMADPSKMVALAELVKAVGEECDDEHWSRYSGYREVSPVAYVACAVSSIDQDGFRKSSEDRATRWSAEFLSQPCPGDRKSAERWKAGQPTEAQIEKAKCIAEWVLTLSEVDLRSEYLWNLHLAMKQPGVGKHAGLLASAPPAYDRAMGIVLAKRAEKKGVVPAQGYIIGRDYGSIAICTFRSDAGHEIVWFASGHCPGSAVYGANVIGQRYQIKGRCKRHQERQGVTQTILSRVTWKLVEAQEKAS